MRLCRYEESGVTRVAFYLDQGMVPLHALDESLPASDDLLSYLPHGHQHAVAVRLWEHWNSCDPHERSEYLRPVGNLRVPIPRPAKLLLLAGNYSKHIEEGGGRAEERSRTFPYVFMKPPTTTLTHPDAPVVIPQVSPHQIDWELELGVVIGKKCRNVREADALEYVAGYTVVNDISDRDYRPNPGRSQREKDSYFDWLHGKWHDTFCPLGPCVAAASAIPDPQSLKLTLRVNGQIEQNSSTAEMVFPVAAIIEFIARSVTLEPGDIISTGTPDGVGKAKGKFLKPGDTLEAEIERIGVLRNPVS